MKQNIIQDKSFDFAVRVVNLYKYIKNTKSEFTLSKQVLRSGTSIGANISEAIDAMSTNDFLAKLYIALKECSETIYWLRLLYKTNYLDEKEFNSIIADASEIKWLLISIIKKTKENHGRN